MIITESIGNVLYEFGRDDNKNIYSKQILNFKPYFFIEDINGEYVSLFNDKLKKIIVDNVVDISKMRSMFTKHFEADVSFINRYMIDTYNEIKKEPIRICYLDIETNARKGLADPENPITEIQSIACFDNFNKKFVIFAIYNPTNMKEKDEIIKTETTNYFYFRYETDMLEKFIEYTQKTDPDILIAWNGEAFDFPYIVSRMLFLKIDANKLSRIGVTLLKSGGLNDGLKATIKGRFLFDLMLGYRKIFSAGRESWSLNYIAQYEKVGKKEEYEGSIENLFYDNYELFIKYNIQDVNLLVLLDEQIKITQFFDEVRRIARCNWDDVYHNTKIVDNLCLIEAKNRKIVLPSKNKTDEKFDPIKGGFVHEAHIGRYENIATFDLVSLYPSIMRSLNLSYETLLPYYKEGCITAPNGLFFKQKSEHEGILASVCTKLFNLRKEYKKLRDQYQKGTSEYSAYDAIQYATKVVLNSVYGASDYPGFRLYKREIASTVTTMGQYIAEHNINVAEKRLGLKVVYGDTDSIFISVGEKSFEELKEIEKELNKSYIELAQKCNIKEHYFEIAFEKLFKKLIHTNAKKRYAGRQVLDGNKKVDKIKIVGFHNVRSDTPQMIRDFQKELFTMCLYDKTKEEIEIYINKIKKEIRTVPPEKIALPIGISRSLNEYKGNPVHIRAARLAVERHGVKINKGDKIKYIYVQRNPSNFKFENVIAFKDKLFEGYIVDYDKMEKRLIEEKINEVFEAMGWIKTTQTRSLGEWMM